MKRPSHTEVEEALDHAEAVLERAVSLAVRDFLRDTTDLAVAALTENSLVAAAAPGGFELGVLYGYWTTAVDKRVLTAIDTIWRAGYRVWDTDGKVLSSSLDALATYTAAVSDRLVRGLTPPLPDDAFNTVRQVITRSAATGWSTKQTAARIGKELAWETDGPYWRQQLSGVNGQIDRILDPLGQPGTAAREAARMNDPTVRALQADRTDIIKQLDREASHWNTRATLIARTESTGAYNYGALNSLQDEGVTYKEWLATSDARTRFTHRVADGQTVKINEPFIVGGYEMQHPGSPSAPPAEVCNCRCTVVSARL